MNRAWTGIVASVVGGVVLGCSSSSSPGTAGSDSGAAEKRDGARTVEHSDAARADAAADAAPYMGAYTIVTLATEQAFRTASRSTERTSTGRPHNVAAR